MLTINTNLSSLIAQRSMKSSTTALNQAIERMSTGYKINHSRDNAANYSIATDMNSQIASLQVAEDNTMMGLDMLEATNGILEEINNRITRLRDLQIQASNGTYGEQSLKAINSEVNALVDEIGRLYNNAEYNGIKLLMAEEELPDGTIAVIEESEADESTKLKDLYITDTTFEVYAQDDSLIQTYSITEDETLGDFFALLEGEGFSAEIINGTINITSNSGKYIAGDFADTLGISKTTTNYIKSTEQSFDEEIVFTNTTVTTTVVPVTTTASTTQTVPETITTTIETTTTRTTETVVTEYTAQTETLYITQTAATASLDESDTAVSYALSPMSLDDGIATAAAVEVVEANRVSNVTYLSSGTTYYITTTDDLVALQNLIDNGNNDSYTSQAITIELANNINMSGVEFNGIGTSTTYGTWLNFNGNGNTISNLTIDNGDSEEAAFIITSEGDITNLTLENCNIRGGNAAGLVSTHDFGVISNCTVSGNISGNSAAGLINFVRGGYVTLTECTINGNINGTSYAGGVISSSDDCSVMNINNTTVNATITSEGISAGVIGNMSADAAGETLNLDNVHILSGDSDLDAIFIGWAEESSIVFTAADCTYNSCYDENSIPFYGEVEYGGTELTTTFTNVTPVEVAAPSPDPVEANRVSNVTYLATGTTYYITTTEDLVALEELSSQGKTQYDYTVELHNNINMSGVEFNGIQSFSGIFNGNGNTISNLTINSASGTYTGLFKSVNNSTITGVNLVNCNITGTNTVGALAGSLGHSTISNCSVQGSVTSTGNNCGGLVGYVGLMDTITNCTTTCNVTGVNNVGGFIGQVFDESSLFLNNSIANGTVTGNGENIGGLVGYLYDGTYQSCTTSCTIVSNGTTNVGAVLGKVGTGETVYVTDIKYNSSINPGLAPVGSGEEMVVSMDQITDVYIPGSSPDPVITTISSDTTLREVIIDADYLIRFMDIDGNDFGLFQPTTTFGNVINEINSSDDYTASLIDGVFTIVAKNGKRTNISPTNADAFFKHITATETSAESNKTITVTEPITIEQEKEVMVEKTILTTTTTETTKTVTLKTENTVVLSGTTTLGDLGLSSSTRVTVVADGTRTSFQVDEDTTIDDFDLALQGLGIVLSEAGGIYTLSASGNTYIDSDNIKNLLKLGALNKIMDTRYVNTISDKQYYKKILNNVYAPGKVSLQVGTNSNNNSQIELDVSFKLNEINSLRGIGDDLNYNFLNDIDKILGDISSRQSHLGVAQNRLESVANELATKYDNLVSSRSTLLDADIAEVSSQYIQQQILQQASATLMATANQSPSIALQLI